MKRKILNLMLVFCMMATMVLSVNAAIEESDYYLYSNKNNSDYGVNSQLFMEEVYVVGGMRYADFTAFMNEVGTARAYLNKDLNDGAGGDDIYLGWTQTADPNNAITGVRLLEYPQSDKENGNAPPLTITRDGIIWNIAKSDDGKPVDLNDGASGSFIYVYTTKDQNYGTALSAICASGDEKDPSEPGDRYDKVLDFDGEWLDVNEGAGGDYIYLTVKSIFEQINEEDLAGLRDVVARAKKLVNASGYNIDKNNNRYKTAVEILDKFDEGSKYVNGYRVFSISEDISKGNINKATKNLQNVLDDLTTTINFDASTNGGSGDTKKDYTIGENTTVEVDLSSVKAKKDGYVFLGWNTDKNATTDLTGKVDAKPGATYYAIFRKEVTLTLEYFEPTDEEIYAHDGYKTVTKTLTSYLYNINATAEFTIDFTPPMSFKDKDGREYTFDGWVTTMEMTTASEFVFGETYKSGGGTLYAVYAIPLTLTFECGEGSAVAPMNENAYWNTRGSKIPAKFTMPVVAKPPEGYKCVAWNFVDNSAATTFLVGQTYDFNDTDYTLYARYEKIEYVAQVTRNGELLVQSEKIDDAIAFATACGTTDAPATITLLANIENEAIIIEDGVVILDLNGHTAYYGVETKDVFDLEDGAYPAHLTIRDSYGHGKITQMDKEKGHALKVGWNTTVVLENGSIEGNNVHWTVMINTGGTFIMNGGFVAGSSSAYAVQCISSDFIMNGGVILKGTVGGSSAKITICGGTFQTPEQTFYVDAVGEEAILDKVSLCGGTFVGGITATNSKSENTPLSYLLADGYHFFTQDGTQIELENEQHKIEETVIVRKPCTAHELGEDGNCTNCGVLLVASSEVDGIITYHAKLHSALNNAGSGTTETPGVVTLLRDIDNDEDVWAERKWSAGVGVLDLNGKTLTHPDDSYGNAAIVVKGGQLTIRDSKTGGTIVNTNTESGYAVEVDNDGILILESGTLCSESDASAVYMEVSNGRFVMTGGEVTSSLGNAVDVIATKSDIESAPEEDGTESDTETAVGGFVEISGGTLSGNGSAITSQYSTVNISGGTLYGGFTPLVLESSEAEISGGTFRKDENTDLPEEYKEAYGMLRADVKSTLTITGGTYENGFQIVENVALDEETSEFTVTKKDLNTVLSEGYGFYDAEDTLVALTEGQTDIDTTVTVKSSGTTPPTPPVDPDPEVPDATIPTTGDSTGAVDPDAWYGDKDTLVPPLGYEIGTSEDGEFGDSLPLEELDLEDGDNEVTYYLKDEEGKITEKTIDIKYDGTAPTVTLTVAVAAKDKFTVTASATDNSDGSGIDETAPVFFVNNATVEHIDGVYSFSGDAGETYTITVVWNDIAGNTGTATEEIKVLPAETVATLSETGTELEPVTVDDVPAENYSVTYAVAEEGGTLSETGKPLTAGTYSYTITGQNGYYANRKGTVTVTAPTLYTVTWVDEDGTTVLEKDEKVPYGTMPSFDGEDPAKADTDSLIYTFSGWTPEISAVTGDMTYTATYSAMVKIPVADTNSFTYNGDEQTYVIAESAYYTVTGNKQTDAGTYTVTVALNDKENYPWSDKTTDDQTYDFVIDRKNMEGAKITLSESLTYNAREQTQNVTVVIDDLSVTCTVDGNKQTDAGNYTLTVTGTGNFTGKATKTWSIAKAVYDMSGVGFTDASYPFDGTEKTLTVTGTLPEGVSVAYMNNTLTNVGSVMATAVFTGNGNYEAIPQKTAVLTVTNATFRVTAAGYDGVYDGKPHTITVIADGATITYSIDDETYTAECPIFTDAGNYTVYYKAVKTNHSDVTGSAEVNIAKATPNLTITPDDNSIRGGGRVRLTVTGAPSEGTYTITCSPFVSANADGSYSLPNMTRTYTFTVSYEASTNYNAASATCTVSVSRYVDIPWIDQLPVKPSKPVKPTTPAVSEEPGKPAEGTKPMKPADSTKPADGTTSAIPDAPCIGGDNCPLSRFFDVDTAQWYHESIEYVLLNNLMNGTGPNTFEPLSTTNRAMIVTVLYRLEGEPAVDSANPFTDLTQDWYVDAVKWAAANGIVEGYGNGKYGPEDSITREQMAVILWRYAKYKGYDVSVGEDSNILSYRDVFETSEWAFPAMQWACAIRVVEDADGDLNPTDNALRYEIAMALHQFCRMAEK